MEGTLSQDLGNLPSIQQLCVSVMCCVPLSSMHLCSVSLSRPNRWVSAIPTAAVFIAIVLQLTAQKRLASVILRAPYTLQMLDLHGNQLSGALPDSFGTAGALSSLNNLVLNNNQLSGARARVLC